ncbi:hypothetical protein Hdeb2414_s0401g00886381 [Helianthus debilis subsp. tardiflorus]
MLNPPLLVIRVLKLESVEFSTEEKRGIVRKLEDPCTTRDPSSIA